MKEEASMKDYIDEFNKAIFDLKNISVPIDDEDQMLFLLCSLPPSYKNVIDITLYRRKSLLVNYIKDILQSKKGWKKVYLAI